MKKGILIILATCFCFNPILNMKRVIITILAMMTVLSAAAQNQIIQSTVKGEKLNFEAPLFGVTKKNVTPKWSLVALGELSGGYSYRMNLPEQIHSNGIFAEMNLLEMRYRPWRDGNLFSLGLCESIDTHLATKTTFFGNDGIFTTISPGWLFARALAMECVVSLDLGYTREFGDWKAGLFFSPGVGYGILQNRYRAGDTGLVGSYRHRDNIYTHNGLRLGVNAGIWYQSIGLIVGWHCRSIDRNNINIFRGDNQNVIHVGISIRY